MFNLRLLTSLALVFTSGIAFSETKLPAPSRTVFKCELAGKIVYSDSPCLGAQKIDVEPTRGLNKSTGRELIGSDVRQEKHRENMAAAIQPITGMNSKQFETYGRRMKLPSEVQKECKHLDIKIPIAEQEEKLSKPDTLAQSQSVLFGLRKRFREIKC
jgi:hypothetical protein